MHLLLRYILEQNREKVNKYVENNESFNKFCY